MIQTAPQASPNVVPALASTPPRPRVARLEVLTSHQDAPGWASSWCERLGLGLTVHRVSEEQLRRYCGYLVDRVSRAGDRMWLLDRRQLPRSGRRQVVAALQDLPGDADVLSAAVGSAIELNAPLELRHAVPLSFAVRSVGLAEAVRSGQRLLDVAAARVAAQAPGLAVSTSLPRMRPQELVSRTDADLLVVGHPGAQVNVGHGLVALTALTSASTSLLLVPRLA